MAFRFQRKHKITSHCGKRWAKFNFFAGQPCVFSPRAFCINIIQMIYVLYIKVKDKRQLDYRDHNRCTGVLKCNQLLMPARTLLSHIEHTESSCWEFAFLSSTSYVQTPNDASFKLVIDKGHFILYTIYVFRGNQCVWGWVSHTG